MRSLKMGSRSDAIGTFQCPRSGSYQRLRKHLSLDGFDAPHAHTLRELVRTLCQSTQSSTSKGKLGVKATLELGLMRSSISDRPKTS